MKLEGATHAGRTAWPSQVALSLDSETVGVDVWAQRMPQPDLTALKNGWGWNANAEAQTLSMWGSGSWKGIEVNYHY